MSEEAADKHPALVVVQPDPPRLTLVRFQQVLTVGIWAALTSIMMFAWLAGMVWIAIRGVRWFLALF